MDPNRFARIQEIFYAVYQLPPTEWVGAVTKAAEGDQGLIAEVLSLLEQHARGEGDLAAKLAAAMPSMSEEPIGPDLADIGPYHILQRLGEGGMGRVYLAEQRSPIRRRVAIKVLKKGLDTKAFLARFAAERQALALMEHTCIARVYDAGEAGSGQPFLVMEYVKGIPITDYCDQNRLDLSARLQLFASVCSGVQHAHSKGVMHRDLKPSNVLVTVQDGRPTPKIIDFGLAKAVDHRLVEATVFTEVGQAIGTWEYMSPEQAGIGGLDVDTRTDVYSLGVLLYELLTGSPPTTRQELLRHGWNEIQRMIREGEPKKPSTKVTTLGAAATATAQRRSIAPSDLMRRLRGDLDWIVMKALEKDRTRRYATPSELAEDIGRHLRDEPVTASAPTAWYLLRKIARRYRARVAAVAIVAAALLATLPLVTLFWAEAAEAREQETSARQKETAARANAEQHLRNYQRLRDRAVLRKFRERAEALIETRENIPTFEAWLADVERWLPDTDVHSVTLDQLRERFGHGGADEDAFLLDQLAMLVDELRAFRGPSGERILVEARLGRLRKTDQEWRASSAEWDAALARIASNPEYAGLSLKPQWGLIPLGKNKDSLLEEFWHPASGDRPTPDPAGNYFITDDTGMVFVLIPGGEATLGTGIDPKTLDAETQRAIRIMPEETPQHTIVLAPFFVAMHECTQGQWKRLSLRGERPSKERDRKGETGMGFPVQRVSQFQCVALLARHGLVLPTEAQWEYSCRAGTETLWSLGSSLRLLLEPRLDDVQIARFNIADGMERKREAPFDFAEKTDFHPDAAFWPSLVDYRLYETEVGAYYPNRFGLLNMHGNVAEWTLGRYQEYVKLQTRDRSPGTGEILRGTNDAVFRGGSYLTRVDVARSGSRQRLDPSGTLDNLGCRAARLIEE